VPVVRVTYTFPPRWTTPREIEDFSEAIKAFANCTNYPRCTVEPDTDETSHNATRNHSEVLDKIIFVITFTEVIPQQNDSHVDDSSKPPVVSVDPRTVTRAAEISTVMSFISPTSTALSSVALQLAMSSFNITALPVTRQTTIATAYFFPPSPPPQPPLLPPPSSPTLPRHPPPNPPSFPRPRSPHAVISNTASLSQATADVGLPAAALALASGIAGTLCCCCLFLFFVWRRKRKRQKKAEPTKDGDKRQYCCCFLICCLCRRRKRKSKSEGLSTLSDQSAPEQPNVDRVLGMDADAAKSKGEEPANPTDRSTPKPTDAMGMDAGVAEVLSAIDVVLSEDPAPAPASSRVFAASAPAVVDSTAVQGAPLHAASQRNTSHLQDSPDGEMTPAASPLIENSPLSAATERPPLGNGDVVQAEAATLDGDTTSSSAPQMVGEEAMDFIQNLSHRLSVSLGLTTPSSPGGEQSSQDSKVHPLRESLTRDSVRSSMGTISEWASDPAPSGVITTIPTAERRTAPEDEISTTDLNA